jgi:hypothetical protein
MRAKKEIKSVTAGELCDKVSPHHHQLTISYTDGTQETIKENSLVISTKYGHFLNAEDKAKLANFAKHGGLFGKSKLAYDYDSDVSNDDIVPSESPR